MIQIFFATPRLLFRRFEPDDLEALARISADAETSRYVGDGQPLSRDETRRWIENSRANVARYGYGTGAVVALDTGALIGWAGIARPDDGGEEIIYGLDKACWGQGLGTELLEAVISWTRETLGITSLRATVHPQNPASIAMLRRAGFRLVDNCHQGDVNSHLYLLGPPPDGTPLHAAT